MNGGSVDGNSVGSCNDASLGVASSVESGSDNSVIGGSVPKSVCGSVVIVDDDVLVGCVDGSSHGDVDVSCGVSVVVVVGRVAAVNTIGGSLQVHLHFIQSSVHRNWQVDLLVLWQPPFGYVQSV